MTTDCRFLIPVVDFVCQSSRFRSRILPSSTANDCWQQYACCYRELEKPTFSRKHAFARRAECSRCPISTAPDPAPPHPCSPLANMFFFSIQGTKAKLLTSGLVPLRPNATKQKHTNRTTSAKRALPPSAQSLSKTLVPIASSACFYSFCVAFQRVQGRLLVVSC